MKTALATLQSDFQTCVMGQATDIFQLQIQDSKNLTALQRIEIYSDAYLWRLIDILKIDFIGLNAMLGEEDFAVMVETYLKHFPSTAPSVRWLGKNIARFLMTTSPYTEKPALAEMATFEWELLEAFDAQDTTIVTINEIAAIASESWPNMFFRPHPSLRILPMHWNVVAIWGKINASKPLIKSKKLKQPLAYLIFRSELETCFRPLEPHEQPALAILMANKNFGQICAGLCQFVDDTEAAMVAATLLKNWLHEGLIASVVVGLE